MTNPTPSEAQVSELVREIEDLMCCCGDLGGEHMEDCSASDLVSRGRIVRLVAALKAELAQTKEELVKWRRIRKPGHGPCCTCQKCGEGYDECRCDLDEVVDELEQTKERLEAAEKERTRLSRQCDELLSDREEAESDRDTARRERDEVLNAAKHLDEMMLRLAFDGGAADAAGGAFGIDPWGTLSYFRAACGLEPTMSADEYARRLATTPDEGGEGDG